MTDTQTVGQRDAATRTYDGTYADLEAILHEWDVHIIDEVDDNPERNPHVGAADLERSGLLDALEAWRDAAVQVALAAQLVAPGGGEYPGTPGVVWHDADGEAWMLCDDGRMRLRDRGPGVDPGEVARIYGPITPAGGV